MKRIALAVSVILFGIGCDRSADGHASLDPPATTPAARSGDVQLPPANVAGAGTQISATYLAGPWCYLHYQAGDERSEERIDYVFNEDGTLLYQNNPNTPVDRKGVWKLEDGTLSIGPSLWAVTTEIHSVEDGRLVLGNHSIQLVLARGACERGEQA